MTGIMKQTDTKSIVLGITGGIAAYKAAELVRLLIKQGMEVQVAMTEAACHFISATTMQALSGKPVLTSQWDENENGMAHINLSRQADAIVIAPATADFIAKLAHGMADDLLSAMCLARDCPLLVAPAMNRQMWERAATQRNISLLKADGVGILGPDSGLQACGEEGMGRMLEAAELALGIASCLHPKQMQGVKVLMTAGPTYEPIDAVRGITNRSSGKMGYAVAQAALNLGAEVTLVSGPVALQPPAGATVVRIETAQQMFDAVQARASDCDIFIGVAAVADYRVAHASAQKIKKDGQGMTLELVPNPDILAYVASLPKPPFCVGFAAESENLRDYAERKRRAKKLPLLAANLAQEAIGSEHNQLILFDEAGEHPLPRSGKQQQAQALLQHIIKLRG